MIENIAAVKQTTTKSHAVNLKLSPQAAREIANLKQPLVVDLELLFSCMIRKQVHFLDEVHHDAVPLDCNNPKIQAWFRAVGTKTCLISDQPVPDLQTFPIKRIEPFMPKWLDLDFKHGKWRGEFGYIASR
ncbi:hypothetical protein [Acidihalobacter aeolianus]|nr:hypothetical protein [Acidihalobacter aeolianus]